MKKIIVSVIISIIIKVMYVQLYSLVSVFGENNVKFNSKT